MSGKTIRTGFDSLAQVAKRFQLQSDQVGQMRRHVQSQMQVLQGGAWIGKGAKAFYNEMESEILPSLVQLTSALAGGAQIVNKILSIMKLAESDAAKLFGGQGAAAGAPSPQAGAAAAGVQAAGGAAAGGGAAGGGGGLLSDLKSLGERAWKVASGDGALFRFAKNAAKWVSSKDVGWIKAVTSDPDLQAITSNPVMGAAGKGLAVIGAGIDLYHAYEHPTWLNDLNAGISSAGAAASFAGGGEVAVDAGASVAALGSEAIAPVVAAGAAGYGVGRLIAPYTIGPIIDAINKPDMHVDMNDFTADK